MSRKKSKLAELQSRREKEIQEHEQYEELVHRELKVSEQETTPAKEPPKEPAPEKAPKKKQRNKKVSDSVPKKEPENVPVNIYVKDGQTEPVKVNAHDEEIVMVPRKRRRKPRQKPKFEDLYTPHTFHIQNDLLERFLNMSGNIKGEKTRMINEAIREYLETFVDENN